MGIRYGREADAAPLAKYEAELFSAAAGEALLRRMLRDGRHVFLLEEEGGLLRGWVWYEFVLDEGYAGDVAVLPPFRKQGLGEALVRAMLSDAQSRGLSFLTLEVRAGNGEARRLYERCGFQTAGLRRNYYEKPAEDAVLMTYTFNKEEAKKSC